MFSWIARQFGKIGIGELMRSIRIRPDIVNRREDTYVRIRAEVWGRTLADVEFKIIDREPNKSKMDLEIDELQKIER